MAWLSDDTMQKLNQLLPPHWSHSNPIDLLGDATPETYAEAIKIAAQNKYSDGILIVLTPQVSVVPLSAFYIIARTSRTSNNIILITFQSMTDPTETAKRIAETAKQLRGTKPILASFMGGAGVTEGRAILDKAQIVTYDYPDTAAMMFSYMYKNSVNISQVRIDF